MRITLLPMLFLFVALAAHGAEFTKPSDCVSGKRVTDRKGKSGAVTQIRNGLCIVRFDDGTEGSLLHWMLSAEGASKATSATGLSPGNYVCTATGAGQFPIVIRDGGRYTDRAGKTGEFKVQGNKEIVFRSGSLAGQYSQLFGPGQFGLSSAKGKMFYTTCNLK